jgi:hypothetical protein
VYYPVLPFHGSPPSWACPIARSSIIPGGDYLLLFLIFFKACFNALGLRFLAIRVDFLINVYVSWGFKLFL